MTDAASRIQALETSLAEAGEQLRKNAETLAQVPAAIAEARRQALEDAAKACEAHMSQCLEDRDIQKQWPQIKARNAVYAQVIRALASGDSPSPPPMV